MKLPSREFLATALRPRRNKILLGVFAFLLIVRIALPYLLRAVIVSQADAALVGHIELEDLDLSLIRGGVTLHGFSVHTDERPSKVPALFECKRLWTQISWLALFTKTIDVEEFELDGFAVRLDRLKDGLLLPKPVPSDKPPEPEPEKPEPLGWSFAADGVAFRDGQIAFTDHTVGGDPQRFDLAIKDLSAQQLELRIDPKGAEPGRLVLEAQIGDGAVGLDAQVTQQSAGTGAISKITLSNLPIDKVRVYLSMFGWSDLSGKLDAVIEHRFEPDGVHEVGGTLSLSDVRVMVPKLERPALGWKKLSVVLDKLDLEKQSAAVAEVELVGARVVVEPKSRTPVPAIAPRETAKTVPAAVAVPAVPAEPASNSKPWTWSVGKARVGDAIVELVGGAQPLPLGVDAEVRSISSEAGSRWPLTLAVKEGTGSLGVDGTLAIAPLAFDGKLAIADLALAPLLACIDAPGARLLRQGTARAELTIALATDLRVAGKLGLAGLDVGDAETAKVFGIAWKDFELGIRELSLPGLLAPADPAKPRAINVNLDLVRLVEPSFKLTRTEQGLLMPSLGSVAVEPVKAAEVATTAPEQAAAAPASPSADIQVDVTKALIEHARAQISDRAVKPFYSTRIDNLDLRASGVHWPGPRVDDLKIAMKGLQGATLDVSGRIAPGKSKIDAKLVKLPLAQFNPYVTPTGYGLSGGSLSLESKATLEKDVYDSSTDLVVSSLEVSGSEGASLFQQNFGIPLSVALGLLKDLDGNITMGIPVAGDRGGTKVGLGPIVGQALRKALMGALASPLKLLGAVTSDGKVQLAPEPILFAPGSSEVAPEGATRIDELADLLSSTPGISLTLSGGAALPDVRNLRERALLAELQATSGLRALGQLGEIGTRRAVRGFLGAKLAGKEPPALDADQEAWLETHVAEEKIDPAALETLASTRAASVKGLLTREHGIADDRLVIGAPVTDPPAKQPGVAIALGALKR